MSCRCSYGELTLSLSLRAPLETHSFSYSFVFVFFVTTFFLIYLLFIYYYLRWRIIHAMLIPAFILLANPSEHVISHNDLQSCFAGFFFEWILMKRKSHTSLRAGRLRLKNCSSLDAEWLWKSHKPLSKSCQNYVFFLVVHLNWCHTSVEQ